MTTTRDKIAGAMFGVALGDAMGRPTEFVFTIEALHSAFGESGLMELPDPALFTDDTQMTIAVSAAIDSAFSLRPGTLMRALRKSFINWMLHDTPRAPGVTCLTAIGKMRRGGKRVSWTHATVINSKGCGANMRVAPAAFIRDIDTALGLAVLQAAMTHGHPTAITATELTALAIRLSAEGTEPTELIHELLEHIKSMRSASHGGYRFNWLNCLDSRWGGTTSGLMNYGWTECENALVKLQDLLSVPVEDRPTNICAVLGGGGWVAEEALALGLYYAIEHCDDAPLAISEAARTTGDSDSIASITGAIVGAHLGIDAWPVSWTNRIERRREIEWMIDTAVMTMGDCEQ